MLVVANGVLVGVMPIKTCFYHGLLVSSQAIL